MTIPKLEFPDDYDPSICKLLPVPIALVPIVGGAMEHLEWAASWSTEGDWLAGRQAIIRLEECLMECDCTATIVEAIRQLQQLTDTCCALASGIPYFEDDEIPMERGEGDPPEGFETWSAHDSYVCRAAQAYVDNLIEALQEVEERTGAGVTLTVGILGAILSFAMPVIGLIISLVAFIAALAATETLDQVVDAFEEAKFDLVCAIFTSTTVTAAMDAIADVINGLSIPSIGKSALACLFTNNALNAIFEGSYEVPGGYQDIYCEECVSGCPLVTVAMGDTVGYHQYAAINAGGGWWYVELMFRMPIFTDPCGDPLDISIEVIAGSVSGSPIEKRWRCYDGEGVTTYQSDDPPDWRFCCQCVDIKSDTPFTVELTYQECEE